MKVGIIGTGFAQQHLEWISACPDLTVTTLAYNQRRERAQALAQRFSIEHIVSGGLPVASSPDVDIVVIVCPPYLHEEFATSGIEAKHVVVCDKPLAHNLQAACRIATLAGLHQVPTMACFQWRDLEAFRVLRAEMADGAAGNVLALDLAFHHDFLADISTPWPWRHSMRLAGGGALADLGVHLFDLLRWLTGSEWQVIDAGARVVWPVRTLASEGAREQGGHQGSLAADTDDIASVHLESASRSITARVYVSRVSHGYQALSVTVIGTRATLRVEVNPSSLRACFERLGSDATRIDFTSGTNPYSRLASDLSTGQRTVPDFRDGLAAQNLMTEAFTVISGQNSAVHDLSSGGSERRS